MEAGRAAIVAFRTYQSEGRPHTSWSTLGVAERIRLPSPAASTMAVMLRAGCRVANGLSSFRPAAGSSRALSTGGGGRTARTPGIDYRIRGRDPPSGVSRPDTPFLRVRAIEARRAVSWRRLDASWPFVQLAGRRVLVPEIRVRVAGGQHHYDLPAYAAPPFPPIVRTSVTVGPRGGSKFSSSGIRAARLGPLPHMTTPAAPASRSRSFAWPISGCRRMTVPSRSL